jgi:hypothetical protein
MQAFKVYPSISMLTISPFYFVNLILSYWQKNRQMEQEKTHMDKDINHRGNKKE